MSADDFQTKYSSVMESMLKSAIAETTKLFETMVDELKAEISRIKKENEDLKTRCGRFESAKSRPTVYGGDSDASEKRDAAVQCDLAPFRMMLVGQRQPLKHSSQNQKKQCGYEEIDYTLLDHNYETQEEGNSQMAFVLVEQESVRGHEGIGSTVVHQPVLSNKPDSPWVCACGTENEGPVINKVCSTGEMPLPQRDEETQLAQEVPFLGTWSPEPVFETFSKEMFLKGSFSSPQRRAAPSQTQCAVRVGAFQTMPEVLAIKQSQSHPQQHSQPYRRLRLTTLRNLYCPTMGKLHCCNSKLSGEPKDGQEKARSSSENGIISEALLNTPCVQPSKPSEVFEKSTAAITTAEPTAVPVTTGETASYLDKEIIGVAVQACEGADDQPIEENQSAALQHLTSVTFKDMSDPHLQMTKTQFLAQLAVSPVTHNLKKTSSRDSADTEASSAETSTSGKRRPQKHSLMAQLRDHIKSHLQARETETNEEPHTEKETCSVSLKNARFENDHPDDKNTAGEPFPLCQKTPGAIEDVTTLKNTPNDPPHISLRRLGLCKDGVKPTRTASKSSFVSSRRSKATIESTPLGPRRSCSGRDSGESTAKKTIPVSPRTSSSTEERATPEMTQNTSVRLMRSSLRRDGVSPKSTTTNSSPDNSKTASVRPKRSSSGRKTECSSVGPRTSGIIKSTDGVGTKINTESTSVKKPRLIQDHTSPKKNLRVVNAKKLAKAAKAKTIAKIKKSNQLHHGGKTRQLAESGGSCEAVDKRAAKTVWTPRLPANKTPPAHLPAKRETRSQDHAIVYPPSDSHNPVSVKAPAVISPLQPLSVIGRHLLKNQCGECGRVLSSSAALESHVSLHTGRRPFSCTLCGKRFPDSKGLKRHGRVHRNGRIHICEQCGKGFVYRFSLTKHVQMVHGRIKPFVCQVCNKGFFTKRDVEAHIRIHTGEKPFHCNLCDKKFTRRVELNVHLRWHNGEKRHWCPFCGKGFLDFNNLKRHKYIHTGEKPHSCPHCPKNFTQSGHLKKHVKCVHKIQ